MGNTVSWMGDQFYLVALPWLILQLVSSSVALGTIMMTAAIPRGVLMLMGGAVSDRISPRKIMIATAWARTILVAAIGVLLWLHATQLWQLYILAFAFGSADAFYAPASQKFMPSLVKPEQLPAANSVAQGTLQITSLIGPAPAGFIVKAFGTAWAFLIDAVSFLFILGALVRLPDPPQAQSASAKKNVWSSIVEGLKYVNQDVPLRSLMLVAAALNFCLAGPVGVGLAWMAKMRFGTPVALGILSSSVAAGSLLGMAFAGVRKARKRGLLLLAVGSVIAICAASIGMFQHLWSTAAILFIMATAAGYLNVQLISWFQQRVDRALLGRVMSVMMFAAVGLAPVSVALAGVAVKWSLPGMYLAAGCLMLLVTFLAAAHRPVREID
jgi:MFS family permease